MCIPTDTKETYNYEVFISSIEEYVTFTAEVINLLTLTIFNTKVTLHCKINQTYLYQEPENINS